ncbi:MAG: hypothetical protein ACREQJ_10380 [Candidatus Binatia bacterium]
MAAYLKTMAVVVGLFGLLCGLGFGYQAVADAEYALKRLARERNPGNILFDTEFRVAEARHIFLIYSATGGFLVAFVGGSLLWGLGALHARLDRS